MIWYRPVGVDRDEDGARLTVPLGTVEAVCDTEDEALDLLAWMSRRAGTGARPALARAC